VYKSKMIKQRGRFVAVIEALIYVVNPFDRIHKRRIAVATTIPHADRNEAARRANAVLSDLHRQDIEEQQTCESSLPAEWTEIQQIGGV
jgi:hypothetical protein